MIRQTSILTIIFILVGFYSVGQSKGKYIDKDTTFNIFNDKSYFLTFKIIPGQKSADTHFGTLTLTQVANGKTNVLLHDTLDFFMPRLQLKDFNNDKINDILILNTSSARSVWTHHLYIVDNTNKKIHRVKGFEKLYDPELDSKNNIIVSTARYSCVYYRFYRINKDNKLVDLGNDFEDCNEHDENYDGSKYNNAIKNINKKTSEK